MNKLAYEDWDNNSGLTVSLREPTNVSTILCDGLPSSKISTAVFVAKYSYVYHYATRVGWYLPIYDNASSWYKFGRK